MKKLSFVNLIKTYSILLLTSILITSCCEECNDANVIEAQFNEKYVEAFVFVPATKANKNGILRLITKNSNHEHTHQAPGVLYLYNPNQAFTRRQKVACKVVKDDQGIYLATEVVALDNADSTQIIKAEIVDESHNQLNMMELHNMFAHKRNTTHRFGHIKNINTSLQGEDSNGNIYFRAILKYSTNQLDTVAIPDFYQSLPLNQNYWIDINADRSVVIDNIMEPIIRAISNEHEHITDPE